MLISTKPKIFDVDLYGLACVLGIGCLTWILVIQPLNRQLQKNQQEQQGIMQSKESSQQKLAQLQTLLIQRRELTSQLSQILSGAVEKLTYVLIYTGNFTSIPSA